MDPSFLPFRRQANSHIYLELQLIQIKQEAINCCKHTAIMINIDYDAGAALGLHELSRKRANQ
jgi:hypothetical protein